MPFRISSRVDDANKHENDVSALVYTKGKLYSGADDGKIKVWEEDLKFVTEIQAHPSSVYSLTASDDTLFSCSNDDTVKAWELGTLKEKGTIVEGQQEFWKVKFNNGFLYVGDSQGGLKVYKEKQLVGEEDTCDPIKDLAIYENFAFTVRDLDLIITEFKPGDKLRATTKKTLVGKAPVTTAADSYLVFASRSGKDLVVHEISSDSQFKQITEVKDAHDMIINALVGVKNNEKTLLYSGGWDRLVKKWVIEERNVKTLDKVDVNFVVNVLAYGENGQVYAAGGDGHIVRLNDS